MLNHLRHFFSPPKFPDEDQTRRAALLHAMLLLVMGATLFNSFMIPLLLPEQGDPVLNGFLLGLTAGLYGLLRRGHIQFVGFIWCLGASAVISIAAYFNDGIHSHYFHAHLVVILLAGLVVDGRAAFVFAALGILSGVANAHEGYLTADGRAYLLALFWTFTAVATIIYFADRHIRSVSERSQIHEQSLREAIQRLYQEIDDHAQVAAALREREADYRRLLDNAPMVVTVSDMDTRRILYVNSAGEELFGAPSAQIIGKYTFDFMPPETRALSPGRLEKLRAGIAIKNETLRLIRLDGQPILVELGTIPTMFEGRAAVLSVINDVTERRKAEDTLRQREADYRSLLDNAPMAISIADLETGMVVYVNAACAEMFGAESPADIIGRHVRDSMMPEAAESLDDRRQLLADGLPLRKYYLQFKRMDGQPFMVELATIPINYGGRSSTLSIMNDVTERYRAEDALREREADYRRLLDNAPLPISITNLETGRLVYINQACAEMFGAAAPEELIGRDPRESMTPESMVDVDERIQRLRSNLPNAKRVLRFKRVNGEPFLVELASIPIVYGGQQSALSMMSDVTERQRAEAELREQKELLQTIFDHIPVMVSMFDPTGRLKLVNRHWEETMGWTLDEALRHPNILEAIYPDIDYYRQVLGWIVTGTRTWHDQQSRTRDGRIIETSWANVLLSDGSSIGIGQDITERKRMEQALRESETRYRQLLELAPVAIAVFWMKNLQWAYFNPACLTLFGIQHADELIGKPIMDFVHPDYRQKSAGRIHELEEHAQLAPTAYQILRVDGETRDVETSSILIEYQGQPASLSVIVDVTERRRAEQEHLQAELLRVELERDRRLLHMKEQFITLMSHEFRTPLTVALSSTEILQKYSDRLTAERRDAHFRKITDAIFYITAMLDDVLVMSRASAGILEFHPELVNLSHFFRDLLVQLDTGGRLVEFSSSGQWDVYLFDVTLLRYILAHLVSNAVKYSPPGSVIRVELRREDAIAVLRVIDQGIGISEADQARLFEPFFRGSNISNQPGTGLGLAIVRASVDAHGGTISCESAPGSGTTFIVRLPLVNDLISPA